MKKFKKVQSLIAFSLAAALTLTACGPAAGGKAEDEKKVTSDYLFVEKVENLPEDFIMGMDASCVPALEAGAE